MWMEQNFYNENDNGEEYNGEVVKLHWMLMRTMLGGKQF